MKKQISQPNVSSGAKKTVRDEEIVTKLYKDKKEFKELLKELIIGARFEDLREMLYSTPMTDDLIRLVKKIKKTVTGLESSNLLSPGTFSYTIRLLTGALNSKLIENIRYSNSIDVALLLKAGASANYSFQTENELNSNHHGKYKEDPLSIACRIGNFEIIQMLIEKNKAIKHARTLTIKTEITYDKDFHSLVYYLVRCAEKGPELLKFYLEQSRINQPEILNTALNDILKSSEIRSSHPPSELVSILSILLAHGADLSKKSHDMLYWGLTIGQALLLDEYQNYEERESVAEDSVLKFLLDQGVEFYNENEDYNSESILQENDEVENDPDRNIFIDEAIKSRKYGILNALLAHKNFPRANIIEVKRIFHSLAAYVQSDSTVFKLTIHKLKTLGYQGFESLTPISLQKNWMVIIDFLANRGSDYMIQGLISQNLKTIKTVLDKSLVNFNTLFDKRVIEQMLSTSQPDLRVNPFSSYNEPSAQKQVSIADIIAAVAPPSTYELLKTAGCRVDSESLVYAIQSQNMHAIRSILNEITSIYDMKLLFSSMTKDPLVLTFLIQNTSLLNPSFEQLLFSSVLDTDVHLERNKHTLILLRDNLIENLNKIQISPNTRLSIFSRLELINLFVISPHFVINKLIETGNLPPLDPNVQATVIMKCAENKKLHSLKPYFESGVLSFSSLAILEDPENILPYISEEGTCYFLESLIKSNAIPSLSPDFIGPKTRKMKSLLIRAATNAIGGVQHNLDSKNDNEKLNLLLLTEKLIILGADIQFTASNHVTFSRLFNAAFSIRRPDLALFISNQLSTFNRAHLVHSELITGRYSQAMSYIDSGFVCDKKSLMYILEQDLDLIFTSTMRNQLVTAILSSKPNLSDSMNEVFRLCFQTKDLSLIKIVVESGIKPSNYPFIMMQACFFGNLEIVKYLVSEGAKIHVMFSPISVDVLAALKLRPLSMDEWYASKAEEIIYYLIHCPEFFNSNFEMHLNFLCSYPDGIVLCNELLHELGYPPTLYVGTSDYNQVDIHDILKESPRVGVSAFAEKVRALRLSQKMLELDLQSKGFAGKQSAQSSHDTELEMLADQKLSLVYNDPELNQYLEEQNLMTGEPGHRRINIPLVERQMRQSLLHEIVKLGEPIYQEGDHLNPVNADEVRKFHDVVRFIKEHEEVLLAGYVAPLDSNIPHENSLIQQFSSLLASLTDPRVHSTIDFYTSVLVWQAYDVYTPVLGVNLFVSLSEDTLNNPRDASTEQRTMSAYCYVVAKRHDEQCIQCPDSIPDFEEKEPVLLSRFFDNVAECRRINDEGTVSEASCLGGNKTRHVHTLRGTKFYNYDEINQSFKNFQDNIAYIIQEAVQKYFEKFNLEVAKEFENSTDPKRSLARKEQMNIQLYNALTGLTSEYKNPHDRETALNEIFTHGFIEYEPEEAEVPIEYSDREAQEYLLIQKKSRDYGYLKLRMDFIHEYFGKTDDQQVKKVLSLLQERGLALPEYPIAKKYIEAMIRYALAEISHFGIKQSMTHTFTHWMRIIQPKNVAHKTASASSISSLKLSVNPYPPISYKHFKSQEAALKGSLDSAIANHQPSALALNVFKTRLRNLNMQALKHELMNVLISILSVDEAEPHVNSIKDVIDEFFAEPESKALSDSLEGKDQDTFQLGVQQKVVQLKELFKAFLQTEDVQNNSNLNQDTINLLKHELAKPPSPISMVTGRPGSPIVHGYKPKSEQDNLRREADIESGGRAEESNIDSPLIKPRGDMHG